MANFGGLFGGGQQQAGFVPSSFDPDDPLAMQKMQAQMLAQRGTDGAQGQGDLGSSLLQGITGEGQMGDVTTSLFPALKFAQGTAPMALIKLLSGAGGGGYG